MRRVKEAPFEVNMVEALVGWKAWDTSAMKLLTSPFLEKIWYPDEPFVAKCTGGCKEVPKEDHICGIYAASHKSGTTEYGTILGEVFGWGRYVRGESGWRAQFAYPKAFYLHESQADMIDALKAYHVPIYIQQPLQIYNPGEEGYDGHWNTEENGYSGTDQVSAAYQEDDERDDD